MTRISGCGLSKEKCKLSVPMFVSLFDLIIIEFEAFEVGKLTYADI